MTDDPKTPDNAQDPSQSPEPYRFDPMTGQPLAPHFDPITGERLVPHFDPMTGERLPDPGSEPDMTVAPGQHVAEEPTQPLTSIPPGPPAGFPAGPPDAPRRRRRRWVIPLVVALVVLLVAGAVTASVILSRPSAEEKAAAAKAKADAATKADQEKCHEALDPTLDALDTVDSRLDVGLNIGDYTALVGDASVERKKVDEDVVNKIDFCKSALDSIDVALTGYSVVASTWNDCIFDDYCDPDSLDLSKAWTLSGGIVDDAHQAIEDGEPTDSGDSSDS